VGDSPILIRDVITQCGCTAPKWKKKSILPENTGKLTIKFDSLDKEGFQRKVITIQYNEGLTSKLVITANVITE